MPSAPKVKMSKKPNRSRHRIPTCALAVESDPVDERYQAEIDASVDHLQRRLLKAEKALEAAEAKADRSRQHADRLAQQRAEAERIALHREEEERRANVYVARIKDAAKNARVASAQAELERQHRVAVDRRNAETTRRKAAAEERLEREQLIRAHRPKLAALESEVAERRRELREIQQLMMPGNYVGRAHRGRGTAQHHAGKGLDR